MAESQAHKRAKSKAAEKGGKTEAPLNDDRRLDAQTQKRATEVERSGELARLKKAAQRLKDSGKTQKVLQVPQKDIREPKPKPKTPAGTGVTPSKPSAKSAVQSAPKAKTKVPVDTTYEGIAPDAPTPQGRAIYALLKKRREEGSDEDLPDVEDIDQEVLFEKRLKL